MSACPRSDTIRATIRDPRPSRDPLALEALVTASRAKQMALLRHVLLYGTERRRKAFEGWVDHFERDALLL